MKTLQRQNTKREIVKKVRFQKNEVAKEAVEKEREREMEKVKGQTTTMQYSSGFANAVESQNVLALSSTDAVTVKPVPVPANFESSAFISNAVNKIDDEETKDEEDVKEPRDAITLSLVE